MVCKFQNHRLNNNNNIYRLLCKVTHRRAKTKTSKKIPQPHQKNISTSKEFSSFTSDCTPINPLLQIAAQSILYFRLHPNQELRVLVRLTVNHGRGTVIIVGKALSWSLVAVQFLCVVDDWIIVVNHSEYIFQILSWLLYLSEFFKH